MERDLNYFLGQADKESDFAVRHYKNNNRSFFILYMGSNNKMADMIDYLKKKTFRYQKMEIRFNEIEGEPRNHLEA